MNQEKGHFTLREWTRILTRDADAPAGDRGGIQNRQEDCAGGRKGGDCMSTEGLADKIIDRIADLMSEEDPEWAILL